MECRKGCGACCIAPSITSPVLGMPEGKLAGQRCIQLIEDNLCALFGQAQRPAFCSAFTAEVAICGSSTAEALQLLEKLELFTRVDEVCRPDITSDYRDDR